MAPPLLSVILSACYPPPPYPKEGIVVTAVPGHFVELAVAGAHACGLTHAGEAFCWGWNNAGQLGAGPSSHKGNDSLPPTRVQGPPFAHITAAHYRGCGLTAAGEAWCWGHTERIRLPTGEDSPDPGVIPRRIGGDLRFAQFSVADWYQCGVTVAGAAYCWGYGDWGELGTGARARLVEPTPVVGGLRFTKVSANPNAIGHAHTCGLTTDERIYCWGFSDYGEIGSGSLPPWTDTPTPIDSRFRFMDVSVGGRHTCALTASGEAWCWGTNLAGELGVETTGATCQEGLRMEPCALRPIRVATTQRFASITSAEYHTCALTITGEAYCWGSGLRGTLDRAKLARATHPKRVSLGLFAAIQAAGDLTCGALRSGETVCWRFSRVTLGHIETRKLMTKWFVRDLLIVVVCLIIGARMGGVRGAIIGGAIGFVLVGLVWVVELLVGLGKIK